MLVPVQVRELLPTTVAIEGRIEVLDVVSHGGGVVLGDCCFITVVRKGRRCVGGRVLRVIGVRLDAVG